ncbi:hypothetical protein [Effusibacillus dendaii]|uniref:Uncharacterized protein n=1 Tax=Effusibacillus dendaii TaxID=2743772 RepID=A0A7I8DBR1_9BACL|nr:hypothetical protein [Effusibacillus dendaii]BCJ87524.1 hypothetical protein skT53_25090 [Effusibacillus dendaii]
MNENQNQSVQPYPTRQPLTRFDPDKEQLILASFSEWERAEQTKKQLNKMGIETIQIDRVSPYPGEPTEQLENPITGNIPSLAELSLGTQPSGRTPRILLAADPAASGMAGEHVTGESVLLTVVCAKNKVEQAVQTIRSNGGNT